MASQAQIDANRRNAARSTGPKTEAGKARARLNALDDGAHARIAHPVLPQENAAELQRRIDQWIIDLGARRRLPARARHHSRRAFVLPAIKRTLVLLVAMRRSAFATAFVGGVAPAVPRRAARVGIGSR